MKLSIVTAAFDEALNLPLLYERLAATMSALAADEWEWVVVDDHSRDGTFAAVAALAARDPRVRGLRLARNVGSHAAIACGLHHATGTCVVALAADLQDPPEVIPQLVAQWRAGAQVVWGVRARRDGESATALGFAHFYYWLMRTVVGMAEMPQTGADFFLLDRAVVDAFARFDEGHTNIFALLTWMGFRQATVSYDKAARLHGRSGWTLAKKVKLVVDSVTSFSDVPIRLMSYLGLVVGGLGLLSAGALVAGALTGRPITGWSTVIVVVLLLGGFQMTMMGVLGEYLWRALDTARRRPQYLIEGTTADVAPPAAPSPPGARRARPD